MQPGGSIQPRERTRELQGHDGEPCHRRRHWYTDCNLTMPTAVTVLLLLWRGHLAASKLNDKHVVNGSIDARREVRMEARGKVVHVRARTVGRPTPSRSDNVGFAQRAGATSPNTTHALDCIPSAASSRWKLLRPYATTSPGGVRLGRRYSSQLCWLGGRPPVGPLSARALAQPTSELSESPPTTGTYLRCRRFSSALDSILPSGSDLPFMQARASLTSKFGGRGTLPCVSPSCHFERFHVRFSRSWLLRGRVNVDVKP